MARAHERWLIELMAGVGAANRGALYELLGHLKETLRETPQRKLRLMRASRENAR